MNLENLIQQHQKDLGELDREILKYILNNKNVVIGMNIIELADKVHVSKSTVLRLTKKIGFTGFSEFKYYLKQNQSNSTQEVADVDVLAAQISDIERTLSYVRSQDCSELLRAIEKAETIYCYGTGYSQRKVLEEFGKLMIIFEKRVIILPNKTEFDMAMPMIRTGDLTVFASLSGETEEVKENLSTLKLRGVPTLAITVFGDNYFVKNADFSLFYFVTPIVVGLKASVASSLIGLNCLIDFLFRKYGDYIRYANQTDNKFNE